MKNCTELVMRTGGAAGSAVLRREFTMSTDHLRQHPEGKAGLRTSIYDVTRQSEVTFLSRDKTTFAYRITTVNFGV